MNEATLRINTHMFTPVGPRHASGAPSVTVIGRILPRLPGHPSIECCDPNQMSGG